MEILRILICAVFVGYSTGKAVDGQRPGPMNAMDSLHGVLMHGDGKQGEDHRGEDKMRVLQEQDELKHQGQAGPQDRMSELHDKLMHPDGKGTHDAKQDGPEVKKDFGVPDAMDHLHGVLMHGDGSQGKDHRSEDERRVEEEQKKRQAENVGNLMDDVHGILMHGDSERGKDHKHEDDKLREETVADGSKGVDPDSALHGGGDHKHEDEVLKELMKDFDPDQLWDENRKNENKPMAFSFGKFISSDILDNVDKLKKRYLSRFFGGGEKKKDDLDLKQKDDSETMDDGRHVSPRMKASHIGPKKEGGASGSGSGTPPHDET